MSGRSEYPCYYCSKWGPCPMCQEKYGLDENGNPKKQAKDDQLPKGR